MKIKLDRYDIAMVCAVTKETGKPILQNLCLRDGKLAVADGFMLVVREANILEGSQDGETLLPASIIKTIRSTPKRQAELVCEDTSLSVSYKDEKGDAVEYDPTLHFKPYTGGIGKYPASPDLFPKDTAKKAYIALNVGLLKKLVTCLPDNGILRIGIVDEFSPLEFECGNLDRSIRGMLMPMYVDWKEFEWHREKPEASSEPLKETTPTQEDHK